MSQVHLAKPLLEWLPKQPVIILFVSVILSLQFKEKLFHSQTGALINVPDFPAKVIKAVMQTTSSSSAAREEV